jgi:hypothetical protein
MHRVSRLTFAAALLVSGTLAGALSGPALAASPPPACVHRVLVLSAMPLELNPLVAKATLNPTSTVHINDRTFYVGRLAGTDVVLALTGAWPGPTWCWP